MTDRAFQGLNPARRAVKRGRRIQEELDARGWKITQLHAMVAERLGAVRGTSYASIRNYVKGVDVDHPRAEIVRAIADALKVPFLYLMDLEGPREGDGHDLWYTAEDERQSEATMLRLQAMNRAALPFLRDQLRFRDMEPVLLMAVADLLTEGGRRLTDYSVAEVTEAVELVAWLWVLPLRAVGTDTTAAALRSYWLTIASAWSQALSARSHKKGSDPLAGLRGFRFNELHPPSEFPEMWRLMDDGLMWAPYCPNPDHDPVHPVAMTVKEGSRAEVLVCPKCGYEANNRRTGPAKKGGR